LRRHPPHLADFHRDSGTVLVRTSKAGKVRHIELTTEGLEFFQEITAGRTGTEFLFHRDGAAWGKSHQQRPLAEAFRVAKVTPAASFHTLRHTYASLMVMDCVPLMVVARNLGHADTRMVEKHYGHLATSYVREAIRAAKPLGIGDAAKRRSKAVSFSPTANNVIEGRKVADRGVDADPWPRMAPSKQPPSAFRRARPSALLRK
jgi:hypothetical protein